MKQLHGDFQVNEADVDTTIDCSCGTSFNVYNDRCDYQCPNEECKRLYRAEIAIYEIDEEDRIDNFVLIGHIHNGT